MLKTCFFRIAYLLMFAPMLILLLTSCSSNKGLQGERIALVQKPESLCSNYPVKDISIAEPELIKKWSQFLTGPRRLPPNIKLLSAEPFKTYRILISSSSSSILSPLLISGTLYHIDKTRKDSNAFLD